MTQVPAKFLTGNLFGHVTVMSLTATLGLMAVFLVDFIDMVFISMLGNAELAAAIGYAGAILFFTTSFSIGMAISAGALSARALGAGNPDIARRTATHTMIYGVLLAFGFAAFLWTQLGPLVALVGAQGETALLAQSYLRIIVPSMPLLMIGMIGSALLRAHGDARRSMMATIVGGIVNGVLDPILIFGLNLDLTGAAIASVAARVAMAIAAVYPLIRHHGGFARPSIGGLVRDLRPVLAIAVPAILTQLATPVGQAWVTRAMATYGEAAVAGMAIIGRLTPVAFGVIFALSGAVGPIIAQNHGAHQEARVRGTVGAALGFAAIVVVAISLALYGLRGPLTELFQAEGITSTLLLLFCGPLALAYFFNAVIFVCNAAFNNLGRPFYSTWINWGRQTLGTIPLVMLGTAWLGAPGVLIGQAAGGVLFAGIALLLVRKVLRELQPASTPEPFQPQTRLFQLFHNRR